MGCGAAWDVGHDWRCWQLYYLVCDMGRSCVVRVLFSHISVAVVYRSSLRFKSMSGVRVPRASVRRGEPCVVKPSHRSHGAGAGRGGERGSPRARRALPLAIAPGVLCNSHRKSGLRVHSSTFPTIRIYILRRDARTAFRLLVQHPVRGGPVSSIGFLSRYRALALARTSPAHPRVRLLLTTSGSSR